MCPCLPARVSTHAMPSSSACMFKQLVSCMHDHLQTYVRRMEFAVIHTICVCVCALGMLRAYVCMYTHTHMRTNTNGIFSQYSAETRYLATLVWFASYISFDSYKQGAPTTRISMSLCLRTASKVCACGRVMSHKPPQVHSIHTYIYIYTHTIPDCLQRSKIWSMHRIDTLCASMGPVMQSPIA